VLLFGGCAALVGTVGVHAVRQNNAARSAVDTFLTAVEHGDTATAQGLLCDQAQPDALQITLDSGIVQHRIVSVFVRRTSAFGSGGSTRESADVTVDVTLSTGIRHRDIVALEHQHGSWLLCGVTRSP
jgi:hypothetical protein